VAANQRVASLFGNFGYLLLRFSHRSMSSLMFITYTTYSSYQTTNSMIRLSSGIDFMAFILRSASCRAVNQSSPAY